MARKSDSLVEVFSNGLGVTVLTLSLPDMRNAMTAEMTQAWAAAVSDVRKDGSVRCIIVTGKGSAFCSGADLSWLDQGSIAENTPDRLREVLLPFYRTWLALRGLEVPTIAAVNGATVGAGLCLALSCDLRYAAPGATFSAPFTRLGTHAGMAATELLPEAVGIVRAREMLYTGRVVSAEEALRWGLVNEVADDVLEHSLEVAAGIAGAAPIATRLTKAGLGQLSRGFESMLQWEALAQPVTMATADIHEGIKARREHREPKFDGR
jgi:enoyl-CoA hydratase/carnithine racemase